MAYLFIILKNIVYGSTVFFTGNLLGSADVLDVLALRFLLSSLIILLLWGCGILKLHFRGKKMRDLCLTAIFEPGLYFVFETLGIAHSSNMTVGILLALTPIGVLLFGRLILKEKTTLMQKICLLFGIGGVVYILSHSAEGEGKDSFVGVLFLLLTVAAASLFIVFSRKTSSHGEFSAMEITCFSAFFGAVLFNAVNIVRHIACGNISDYFEPLLIPGNIPGFVVLAFVSSILATAMNNYALSKISATKASCFSGLSTVTTIVMGMLLNHEPLYAYHVIGTVVILLSVFGVNYFAGKKH